MVISFSNTAVVSNFQELLSCGNEVINEAFEGYLRREEQALASAEEKNREILTLIQQLFSQIKELEEMPKEEYGIIYAILSNTKKIKYNHDKLINYTRLKNNNVVLFSDTAAAEIEELFKGTRAIYGYLYELLLTRNPVLLRQIFRETNRYELLSFRYSIEHEERMTQGICLAKASSVYLHLLETFEDILWHLHFMAVELKKL